MECSNIKNELYDSEGELLDNQSDPHDIKVLLSRVAIVKFLMRIMEMSPETVNTKTF